MSLAVITGHCYRSYWAQIGDNTPVLESATVIFGVRDLDPAEQQRFQQSQIRMVKWRDGNPQGDVRAAAKCGAYISVALRAAPDDG